MRSILVYGFEHIDYWDGWLPWDAFREGLHPDQEGFHGAETVADADEYRAEAERIARAIGWEGDIREGPYVAGLPPVPGNYWPNYLIAWKQDNNGMTFVASPLHLPWLNGGSTWIGTNVADWAEPGISYVRSTGMGAEDEEDGA